MNVLERKVAICEFPRKSSNSSLGAFFCIFFWKDIARNSCRNFQLFKNHHSSIVSFFVKFHIFFQNLREKPLTDVRNFLGYFRSFPRSAMQWSLLLQLVRGELNLMNSKNGRTYWRCTSAQTLRADSGGKLHIFFVCSNMQQKRNSNTLFTLASVPNTTSVVISVRVNLRGRSIESIQTF